MRQILPPNHSPTTHPACLFRADADTKGVTSAQHARNYTSNAEMCVALAALSADQLQRNSPQALGPPEGGLIDAGQSRILLA